MMKWTRLIVRMTVLTLTCLSLLLIGYSRQTKSAKHQLEMYSHLKKEECKNMANPSVNTLKQLYLSIKKYVKLPLCPEIPPGLTSKVDIEKKLKEIKENPGILGRVLPGGTFIPPACRAKERLAVLVPYRDREDHLKKFIPYMHAFLQKQQVHYTIFVVEMVQGPLFNRGLILNIAFMIADQCDDFTCFIMTDVDLLPTNEHNLYRCGDVPRHLCHSNSKYNYTLLYPKYLGGSIALNRDHFYAANGYSNLYFGWGSEDDDFQIRLVYSGYNWTRIPEDIGVYQALEHGSDTGNPYNPNKDYLFADASNRIRQEGLNTLKFKLEAFERRDLFTWALVDVNQAEITRNYTHLYPKK